MIQKYSVSFNSMFSSFSVIVILLLTLSCSPSNEKRQAVIDGMIDENKDSLNLFFNNLDSILLNSKDHPNEKIDFKHKDKDSLISGILIGLNKSSVQLQQKFNKKNTCVQKVEDLIENKSYTTHDPHDMNMRFTEIRNRMKYPENKYSDFPERLEIHIKQLLKFRYVAVEDIWYFLEPELVEANQFNPGLLFKKVDIYDVYSRKKLNSFFLTVTSSDKVNSVSVDGQSYTLSSLINNIEYQFSRKRDSILYSK